MCRPNWRHCFPPTFFIRLGPLFFCLSVLTAPFASPLHGAENSSALASVQEVPSGSREALGARELSKAIDTYFERHWRQYGITPSQPADDAEFVRRAYLDLVGHIPSVSDVRTFLENPDSDKRHAVIDSLLQQGACATHFANVWRAQLLGASSDDQLTRALTPGLETWLKLRFAANMPYDQMVRELLLAQGGSGRLNRRLLTDGLPDPSAFYQASERKAELLAASSSRVFLGLQVQCAQCHDHPHAHWTRQEFWSFTALFSEYAQADGAAPVAGADPKGLKIPDTETFVKAAFLDGSSAEVKTGQSSRVALVHWITSDDNQWFSQAVVNRVCEQMLGRGLVDPVDDLEAVGPDDHVELLNSLAWQFRAHNYDLRYLLQAIAGTRLYQFTSRTDPAHPLPRQHFARMPLRQMTGEQLFDSLVQATGMQNAAPANNNNAINDVDSLRGDFLQKFSESNIARTEGETTILQALSLMNGKLISEAVDLKSAQTLAAVSDAPFLDNKAKVETLFLATLGRYPSADESQQFVAYVDKVEPKQGEDSTQQSAPLADVLWALLNSSEFVLVH